MATTTVDKIIFSVIITSSNSETNPTTISDESGEESVKQTLVVCLALVSFGCAGTLHISTDQIKDSAAKAVTKRTITLGERRLVIRGNIPQIRVKFDLGDVTTESDGQGKITLTYKFAGMLRCQDRITTSVIVTAPDLRINGRPPRGVSRVWVIQGNCGSGQSSNEGWLIELEGESLVIRTS